MIIIKAVFFDLYQTLIGYEPPREQFQEQVLKESGIDVTREAVRFAMVLADEYIYQEHARQSLSKRSPQEKLAVYTQYQRIVLREVGVDASEALIGAVLNRMRQFSSKLVLFNDVIPAMRQLKERGLTLGLISNVDRDITSDCEKLGLTPWLEVVVTSQDTGFNKPQPEIFQEALRRAGVEAAEAVYVGDQYQIDMVGARQAGMKGIFLDRGNDFTGVVDYPRIGSLCEIVDYL